jgi:hemoglobin-like flavoprotein
MADTTAALFYGRLFAIDPAARRLFAATDMTAQGTLFMQMLTVFVRSLDDLSKMEPAIESSGKRHQSYGVVSSDYDVVGQALLWAFAQSLGSRFTPAARDAWTEAYRILAGTMQRGALAAV